MSTTAEGTGSDGVVVIPFLAVATAASHHVPFPHSSQVRCLLCAVVAEDVGDLDAFSIPLRFYVASVG